MGVAVHRLAWALSSGIPRGVIWGVQPPPPKKNSEDTGGVLDRMIRRTGVSISFCSSLCSHAVVIH